MEALGLTAIYTYIFCVPSGALVKRGKLSNRVEFWARYDPLLAAGDPLAFLALRAPRVPRFYFFLPSTHELARREPSLLIW